MIKPVLKRSLYHKGSPVIVTFKSFEVWLIHSQTDKMHKPIYIPLSKVQPLVTMTQAQLEQTIVKSLKHTPSGFVFQSSQDLTPCEC